MMAAFTGSSHLYHGHAPPKMKRRLLATEEPSRHRRVATNQSDLDIRVSRVSPLDGESKGSMLAYTERMRSIARTRGIAIHSGGNPGGTDSTLVVRAKHITHPRNLPKLRSPGGQESFESWSEVSKPKKDALRVNTVSASDLRDLVDHSLYTKGTRRETVKLVAIQDKITQFESEERARRSTSPKSVSSGGKHADDKNEEDSQTILTVKGDSLSPVIPHWSVVERNRTHSALSDSISDVRAPSMFDVGIKTKPKTIVKDHGRFTVLADRPKKIKVRKPPKRMKLHRSSLDSIPENETLSDVESSRPHSQVSLKMSPIVDLSEDHYPSTLPDHSSNKLIKPSLSSIPEGIVLPQSVNSGFGRSMHPSQSEQTKQVVNIKIIDSGESILSSSRKDTEGDSDSDLSSYSSSVDAQRAQHLTNLRFNLAKSFAKTKLKQPSELSVKGAYLRSRLYEPKSKTKLPSFGKKRKKPKIRFLK